ncbi:unnamed protein product [Dibothriocephalus latus]|uniref:Large ribosomal subunit protein uL30 N-terminal eukaryotes domain-containing protein n=1 Tax=Dibothriocephalus latus TaxID=60516 RepID=A0A3P7Q109_DIBLA|nr:unnamed protein product [Dibothriocephalus latus]
MKRAQKHLAEYSKAQKREVNLKRNAEKFGNFYVEAEPRLAFAVRIRGINGIHPEPHPMTAVIPNICDPTSYTPPPLITDIIVPPNSPATRSIDHTGNLR